MSLERVGDILPKVLGKFGIETVYKGIEYRSRLEARWAAFFDGCGWPFVYEPFDLPGWIPDFLLGKHMLVEVKPFTALVEFDEAISKAHAAMSGNVTHELLLVGVAPFKGPPYSVCIGWLGEVQGSQEWSFGPAIFGRPYANCVSPYQCDIHDRPCGNPCDFNRFVLCSHEGSWRDRISGDYDDDSRIRYHPNDDWKETEAIWAAANNLTKWKPSNGRP